MVSSFLSGLVVGLGCGWLVGMLCGVTAASEERTVDE